MELKEYKPIKNIIGNQYGRITITSFSHSDINIKGRKYYYFTYKCNCGYEDIVNRTTLHRSIRYNGDFACPKCYKSERKISLKKGNTSQEKIIESVSKRAYSYYKKSSKARGLKLEIDFELFKTLIIKDCYYCGLPASSARKEITTTEYNSQIMRKYFNGLDRKDSKDNYRIDNVVTCCEDCNKAKQDLSYDQFLELIERIYKFRIINDGKI